MPSDDAGTGTRRGRRNDPGRRERIIDACLDVIAEVGVNGVSHRKVAAAAGVPLGSMTYHFSSMDQLLREAFTRFAGTVADQFERRMDAVCAASRPDDAVALIVDDVFGEQRDLVLTTELYSLAARDPSFREITTAWMARSRAALERHLDPETARIVDALIEGLTLHRALDRDPGRPGDNADAVRRVIASRPSLSPGARAAMRRPR